MKETYKIIIFAAIVVALVATVVFYYGNNSQPSVNVNNTKNNLSVSNSSSNKAIGTDSTKISSLELQKHNLKGDCWVAYKGKVYDITAWLPKHPGSAEAIAPYCGKSKEFEEAFSDQHGTSQVGKLISEGIYKGDLI